MTIKNELVDGSLVKCGYRAEIAIFVAFLMLFTLLPSNNNNYADDSLRWAYGVTLSSGLISSHHLYLNPLREVYHILNDVFGIEIGSVRLLAIYSAFWGAVGLAFLYRLLRFVGCNSTAMSGTLLCAFASNYWLYSIVGDVYIPATALLVIGLYAFLRIRTDSNELKWTAAAVASFVLMTLHHQAYPIFVLGIAASSLLSVDGSMAQKIKKSSIVLISTGVTSLAIYGCVYRATPNPEGAKFSTFVSGYAENFDARPDQKLLSLATLTNSFAGEVRAFLPYYVIYRSDELTGAIQKRFPYRNVYPYPYLVRSLTPTTIALILSGIAMAVLAVTILFVRGTITVIQERKEVFAILLAMIPMALFFIWWEGLSDEFWIWTLPLVAMLTCKGVVNGERWSFQMLNAGVVGLFVSSLLGAVLLVADPKNDIDAVNRRYLADIGAADLLVGFDEIQSVARVQLAMEKKKFRYFNVFDRSFNWSDGDLEDLKREIADTLAGSGKIFVDSYVTHPPKSQIAWIMLKNQEVDRNRQKILEHLRSVDPSRIYWVEQTANVPGYFIGQN
jgi:hypothetical protein